MTGTAPAKVVLTLPAAAGAPRPPAQESYVDGDETVLGGCLRVS
jgi:hypothetical protein